MKRSFQKVDFCSKAVFFFFDKCLLVFYLTLPMIKKESYFHRESVIISNSKTNFDISLFTELVADGLF